MDSGILMVILVFCVGPLITFMAGFAVGRWSKTYTIARRDVGVNNEVKSARYAPTSTRGVRQSPPKDQPPGVR